MRHCLAIVMATALVPVVSADDHRAGANYTLHCQGCHLAGAVGYKDEVPRMKDFVGYFLHSAEGRAFLIRVPGVATASLPDDQLAELMNWLLLTYSSEQLPERFAPFTVDEVTALRKTLEPDPGPTRMRILRNIARDLPRLAAELGEQSRR